MNFFSEKSQIINLFTFVGHIISVTAIQLCHYNVKASIAIYKRMGVVVVQQTIYKTQVVTEFDPQIILYQILF